jgi:hypothetical protein
VPLSEGTIGFCGTITSIHSVYEEWNKAAAATKSM